MASRPPVPAFEAPPPRPKASAFNDGAKTVNAAVAERKTGDFDPAQRSIGTDSHAGARSGTSNNTSSGASREMPEALLRYSPPEWAADVAPTEAAARTQATAAAAFKEAAASAGADGASNDDEDIESSMDASQYMEAATPWRLEVMKGGMPMGEVELGGKTHLSLGRQGGGACDVVLEHPSISRAHAVMQHHLNGTLWIFDLGSAHGTFVNKRALAPKTFEQVRPGDVLKFGESQRIYLLTGPEYQRPPELESETLAKVRQALKEKETRREARKQALELARQGSGDAAAVAAAIAARVGDVENSGVSWGMRDDGESGEGDGEGEAGKEDDVELPEYLKNSKGKGARPEHSTSLGDGDKHQRDEALWTKLQAKVTKLNNLEEEVRRIMSKEGGTTQNEARIATLTDEVATLEHQIRSKNLQRGATKEQQSAAASKKKSSTGSDSDSDDGRGDDYLDRTTVTTGRGAGVAKRRRGLGALKAGTLATANTAGSNNGANSNNTSGNSSGHGSAHASLPPHLAGQDLTEEVLTAELARLQNRSLEVMSLLAATAEKCSRSSSGSNSGGSDSGSKSGGSGSGGDDLEAFMEANAAAEAAQQHQALSREQEEITAYLGTVRSLLRVVAPALKGLHAKNTPAQAAAAAGVAIPVTGAATGAATATGTATVASGTPSSSTLDVSIETAAPEKAVAGAQGNSQSAVTSVRAAEAASEGGELRNLEGPSTGTEGRSSASTNSVLDSASSTGATAVESAPLPKSATAAAAVGAAEATAPEPKKRRVLGAQRPPASAAALAATSSADSTAVPSSSLSSSSSAADQASPPSKRTRSPLEKTTATGGIETTTATTTTSTNASAAASKGRTPKGAAAGTAAASAGTGAMDESSAEVWVPPPGQTGDGKTALNAKFGY